MSCLVRMMLMENVVVMIAVPRSRTLPKVVAITVAMTEAVPTIPAVVCLLDDEL